MTNQRTLRLFWILNYPTAMMDPTGAEEVTHVRDRLIHPFTMLVGLWGSQRWRRGFVVWVSVVVMIVMW